ncbi:unnamed protein product [Symbiodinium sp. CCMP2456]|nr:unnamed protein product [Symbiodinium sp. CCMP2456]
MPPTRRFMESVGHSSRSMATQSTKRSWRAGLRAMAILVIAGLQLRSFCTGRSSKDPAPAVGISYATHRLGAVCHRAANEPRELVDLYGMKTRELKAFLKNNGVFVDDCFDMDSLIQRASATEEDWGRKDKEERVASAPASASEVGDSSGRPGANEVEKAWKRLCEAWPGQSPRVLGPTDADKTVILLHGFGDQNSQFLADTFQPLLNIQGLRLILPQAPEENLQGQQLQSWFLPINGQWIIDDKVVQPVAAYLHAMVRREIALGVPAHRILIGGFAQGAGCALRAALSFPDAALGGAIVLSGFFGAPEVSPLAAAVYGLYMVMTFGEISCLIFEEHVQAASRYRSLESAFADVDLPRQERRSSSLQRRHQEFVQDKMSKVPADPLAFDPANLTPEPPPTPSVQAPPPRAAEETGGIPTMDPQVTLQLLNDQEIADAATDPEGMAIIQDVIMNPSNLELHKQNPRVAKLVAKLESWPHAVTYSCPCMQRPRSGSKSNITKLPDW